MPELVNSSVGSFFSTRGAEGTMVWPLLAKKSKNFRLIEPESIPNVWLSLVLSDFYYITPSKTWASHKIKRGMTEYKQVSKIFFWLVTTI